MVGAVPAGTPDESVDTRRDMTVDAPLRPDPIPCLDRGLMLEKAAELSVEDDDDLAHLFGHHLDGRGQPLGQAPGEPGARRHTSGLAALEGDAP